MDVFLTARAWRGYRRADFPAESREAADDVLHAFPNGTVSLISQERYADFDLSLEWRLPVGGNSGTLYRVTEEYDAPSQSGLEMQLLGNSSHPDGRVAETSCGALYGLQAPENVLSCPPGLFNIARVSVRGSQVEHWLNGARVLACDIASEEKGARLEFRRPARNSNLAPFSSNRRREGNARHKLMEVRPMATYDYRCKDCGEQFTRDEHIAEHTSELEGSAPMPRCPKCESQKVEPVVSAPYVRTSKKS